MNNRAIYGFRQADRHQKYMKRKVSQDICNSVALLIYIVSYFSTGNRLIYQRKAKDDKNCTIWMLEAGEDPEIMKRGGDFLGFRWPKKAKIMLETISFWQNISINILKFPPFLYPKKVCQWNLISFSKFSNALIRKENKHLCSS